jgi:hypothetical protein
MLERKTKKAGATHLLPQQKKKVFVPEPDTYYSWLRKDLLAKAPNVDPKDYPIRQKWIGPAIQHAKHHFHITYNRKSKKDESPVDNFGSAFRQSSRLKKDDVFTASPIESEMAPHPTFNFQSTQLRRLVTEDMLLLEPGSHVLVAVTEKHPYFQSTWLPCLEQQREDCIENELPPPAPVLISNKEFFSFDVTITGTPQRDRLLGGELSREEFQVAFSMQQGASLHIQIECTGDEVQMKYAELLEC